MAQEHVFPEQIACTGGLTTVAYAMIAIGHRRATEMTDVLIDCSHSIDAPDSIPAGSMYNSSLDGKPYQTFTYR